MDTREIPPITAWLRMQQVRQNVSLRAIAKYAGLSTDTVKNILDGITQRPSPETIRALADWAHWDYDDLMAAALYLERAAALSQLGSEMRHLGPAGESEAKDTNVIMVPVVSSPVSAGPGAYAEVELWPYRPKDEERQHSFIGIVVRGDCLEPRIHPGEELIVDQEASPRHEDVVVIEQDGEILLKVYERRNGSAWLVAYHHHEPLKVTDDVKILGVVRKVSREP